MATLTLDLIRKKAEHHTDTLATLQELSLHQLNLAHLTPILSQACPQLRILYLHNNLLPAHPTIKQLHRLKSLAYLNLTLNNLTHLPAPHTAALEKLSKLDLTLNHIAVGRLDESLTALAGCERLVELYLTGNPCTKWGGCRLWVVGRLPRLQRLDGVDVTRSERLEAQRDWQRLTAELHKEIEKEQQQKKEREHKHAHDEKEPTDEAAKDTRFTPELRLRMYEEQQAAEAAQQAEASASSSKFAPSVDLYTAARDRLNTFLDAADYSESNLPSQRNIGRYAYTMREEAAGRCVVLRVELPRFMDTSCVRVDVQPWWLQVDVKGALLVLHTGAEVETGKVSVKRVQSDGSLVVRMPTVRKEAGVAGEEEEVEERVQQPKRETEQVVLVKGKRGAGKDGWESKEDQSESKQPTRAIRAPSGMTELSVTRSLTLEAKRQMEQAAASQRQKKHQPAMQLVAVDDDDDEVPPLI